MARRQIPAGLADDVRAYGIPLWEPEMHRAPYVRGKLSDDGPLSALLWADLRRAYRRLRIDHRRATIFEMWLLGATFAHIARMFRIDESTVRQIVLRVQARLAGDDNLGILTVIVEECGGWRAVGEFLY